MKGTNKNERCSFGIRVEGSRVKHDNKQVSRVLDDVRHVVSVSPMLIARETKRDAIEADIGHLVVDMCRCEVMGSNVD